MNVLELIELLIVELKDDIVGMRSKEENTIVIRFGDGTQRTITVE